MKSFLSYRIVINGRVIFLIGACPISIPYIGHLYCLQMFVSVLHRKIKILIQRTIWILLGYFQLTIDSQFYWVTQHMNIF